MVGVSAIVWFRRDLRLADHPALAAALARAERVIPCFCFDRRLLGGRNRSGSRTQFMLEALAELDVALRACASALVVRDGDPARSITELALQTGASSVHVSEDVSPYATRRDAAVQRALAGHGVEFVRHPGVFVVDDPRTIRTSAGGPYTVFTPFHRAWLGVERRAVVPAPQAIGPLPAGLDAGRLPALAELGLQQEVRAPARGGEAAGRAAAATFLERPVRAYLEDRDQLGVEGTSRLSPYLHFGCVSARELERALPAGPGGDALRRQLCWRDFYAQVLAAFPGDANDEHQLRWRRRIRWVADEELFGAWRAGLTGYPLVDAGMRALSLEGWMHNRARLVVASFLTKHLGIDWRWGERHFMRLLLDGDEASNNGNWQWISSVGVDPQPLARRILSPSRQQQRFDPAGDYVRRYVPELQAVPGEYLAQPWLMPAEVQRRCGAVIGVDYPAPVVEHAAARKAALERFAAAKAPA